jgi:hypothetical protein
MCIRSTHEEAIQAVRHAESSEKMASVLSQHFAPPGSDIETVVPTDWSETAGVGVFQGIEDAETRELALKIFSLWPLLFCKACSVNCLHSQLASALKKKTDIHTYCACKS